MRYECFCVLWLGFKREISVTNVDEQTTEEELTWGVDSEVEVEPRHRAEAKLIILEEEYKGLFELKTTIRGRVRISFYNLKDNNSFIRAIEGQIDQIITEMMAKTRSLPADVVCVDKVDKTVVCTTRGRCQFKYGLKQDVEIDQVSLNHHWLKWLGFKRHSEQIGECKHWMRKPTKVRKGGTSKIVLDC